MPRVLSEDKELLLTKLLREGTLSIRAIAEKVKCGTGTVTRRKRDLGFEVRVRAGRRVTRLLAPQLVDQLAAALGPLPSAAALRLAAFDPIVRRALANRQSEEPEDGE